MRIDKHVQGLCTDSYANTTVQRSQLTVEDVAILRKRGPEGNNNTRAGIMARLIVVGHERL
jgi:hypothetical protein